MPASQRKLGLLRGWRINLENQKIDVAVLSYKKPESLVYTLLSLKAVSGQHIDTIYIDDDQSGEGTVEVYSHPDFIEAMAPIKIKVRVNEKHAGVYFYNKGMFKRPKNFLQVGKDMLKGRKPVIICDDDVRYQWALNQTDKKWLMIIHDDIKFYGDVIGLYLDEVSEKRAIIGDLGQCWRCGYENSCSPEKIMQGKKPNNSWPIDNEHGWRFKRACRVNEWSALINMDVAKKLYKKSILFGQYEDFGDIGAYWFDEAIAAGYEVYDPLAGSDKKAYYDHGWQGFSGHSVWVDQGNGKSTYDGDAIKELIKNEYGVDIGNNTGL